MVTSLNIDFPAKRHIKPCSVDFGGATPCGGTVSTHVEGGDTPTTRDTRRFSRADHSLVR